MSQTNPGPDDAATRDDSSGTPAQPPEALTGDSDPSIAEAAANIDALIAEVGPERAREMMELLLTELVVEQDPEAQN